MIRTPLRGAGFFVALLVLASRPAPAREPRTVKLRFPHVSVAAGTRPELCVFVPLRATTPFDLESWDLRVQGARGAFGIAHFLVYLYRGERFAEFAADAGRVVSSRACLALGPSDRDRRQLVASGFAVRARRALPPGVALRLAPTPRAPGEGPGGIGFLLDINWVNGADRPRVGSASATLRRAPRNRSPRIALPLEAASAELGLLVPPSALRSTETSTAALNALLPDQPPVRDVWGPGVGGGPAGDVCVLAITGRMHERGRFLGVDVVDAGGNVLAGGDAVANPFEPGRRHFFGAVDYTDPGTRSLQPPLLLRAGQMLRYECWTENGVSTPTRLGCEERAGEPPGTPRGLPGWGPARPCTEVQNPLACPSADPAYPGRSFTGACVVANAVGGATPDDEACALTGFYFDALPGASGSSCDASSLAHARPLVTEGLGAQEVGGRPRARGAARGRVR